MARLFIAMTRDDEDGVFEGSLVNMEMTVDIGDPDSLEGWLNAFSSVLRAAGFSYDAAGVYVKQRDGTEIEHWSDY